MKCCNLIGAVAHSSATFGQGIGEIYLDNVQCTGSESSLLACSYVSIDNCFHSEDAGVQCNGPGSKRVYSTERYINITLNS